MIWFWKKLIYINQKEPKHYGTLISWRLGGNDPLDDISVYDGGDYWHFVTFGLSELYEKETDNADISGYGMEFTFKLKKDTYEGKIDPIIVAEHIEKDLNPNTSYVYPF